MSTSAIAFAAKLSALPGPRSAYALGALVAAVVLPLPIVAALVLAPVLEETVFRGGLQEALLRRLGPQPARLVAVNVVTASVFAAAHLFQHRDAWAVLTLLPALAIGAVYQRQRRLVPCMALHALFNGIWLLAAGLSLSA